MQQAGTVDGGSHGGYYLSPVEVYSRSSSIGDLRDPCVRPPKCFWVLSYALRSGTTRLICLFLASSILGNILHPVWFTFGLVDIPAQSRAMMDVIDAVFNNIKKLVLTFVLAIMVLYALSSLVYHWETLRGNFSIEDVPIACHTLWECWFIHMTYGLMFPPVWSHRDLVDGESDHHTMPVEAGMYILFYSVLVNLVLSAIVSGIIIDSFSELRQKSDFIREDMQERCFICGIDRENFETLGLSFPNHISHDHNMWQYLWFRIHLDNKDSTSYTGQEQYVQDLIQSVPMITSFFPIKKAMIIEGHGAEEKKDMLSLFAKVETMSDAQSYLVKNVVAQEKKIDELTSLVKRLVPAAAVQQFQPQPVAAAAASPATAVVEADASSSPSPTSGSVLGVGGTGPSLRPARRPSTVAFADPPAT
jgi:hypothetical protein